MISPASQSRPDQTLPRRVTAPRHAVICGEALIDLVPDRDDDAAWTAMPGGSPFNTSVALAKLRMPTQFLGRVSDDAFGTQMRLHLARSGVDDRLLVRSPDPSTLAVVSLDHRSNATYTFYWAQTTNAGWQLDELPECHTDEPPAVLHIGSLAAVMPPAHDVLYEWFARYADRVPVSYDLNVRPTLLPDAAEYGRRVDRWLHLASVAKASEEDVGFLHPGERLETVAAGWLRQHPRLHTVVFTRGGEGVLAFERGGAGAWVAPTLAVEVVDTVGAGDTFTAGFLQARYELGLDLPDALVRALVAGALVCTRRGALPPVRLEVDAVVEARGAQLVPRLG